MRIFVNNVNLYYETYGDGQPIILLHGNSENHKIIVGILVAIKEPNMLSKLIVSGANVTPDGIKKTV